MKTLMASPCLANILFTAYLQQSLTGGLSAPTGMCGELQRFSSVTLGTSVEEYINLLEDVGAFETSDNCLLQKDAASQINAIVREFCGTDEIIYGLASKALGSKKDRQDFLSQCRDRLISGLTRNNFLQWTTLEDENTVLFQRTPGPDRKSQPNEQMHFIVYFCADSRVQGWERFATADGLLHAVEQAHPSSQGWIIVCAVAFDERALVAARTRQIGALDEFGLLAFLHSLEICSDTDFPNFVRVLYETRRYFSGFFRAIRAVEDWRKRQVDFLIIYQKEPSETDPCRYKIYLEKTDGETLSVPKDFSVLPDSIFCEIEVEGSMYNCAVVEYATRLTERQLHPVYLEELSKSIGPQLSEVIHITMGRHQQAERK